VPADPGLERLDADACLPALHPCEDVDQRLEALFLQVDSNAAAPRIDRGQLGVEACEMVDQRQTDAFVRHLDDNRVLMG
jgi:hypothetical protein